MSSDAGLVLLKDPDEQLGLTRALAAVLSDPREARRVNFTQHDLLKQRVLQIAAGYEDANDANTCATIPSSNCCLIACRKPAPPWPHNRRSHALKTASHAPNSTAWRWCWWIQFLASYSHPPKVIVLDVDDTEDRAHGQQEQARYDGYYGGYCFLPLHLYEGLSGRLITAIFKAKRFTGAQMLAVLKRLVKRLRHAWPHTLLIVRGDSHFAYPEVMQWIEAQADLSYVTGLTSNAVLQAWAREVVEQAKRAYGRDGGKITRFHSTSTKPGRGRVRAAWSSRLKCPTKGQHPLCRDGYGARPHPGGLSAHLLCSGTNGKRDQRSQTLPEIGSYVLSSLRGQPVAVVAAFGRLRVTRYATP